jgi:preprotein translocase subunit YajC
MAIPFTLITLAAAAQKKQTGGGAATLLPFIFLAAIFYFVMMRPQQRRAQQHRALLADIKQGDKVVAAGGIVGTVRRVDDDTVSLQVADNVVLKVDKATVSRKIEASS